MQIHQALAALAHVQSFVLIAGAFRTATPISSVVTAHTESHPPSDRPLALIPTSRIANSTTQRRLSSIISPSSQSSTTLISPQGLVPFHVENTPTTLLFHSFGILIPSSYLLQCLAVSLTFVLKITREGKGRDLIENGFFTNRHVLPNGDNVTITIVDFRESERPMTYLNVRDVLTGIGDFMTEPGRGVSVCSYEVEVEGKGYVGTGHVDYDPEERSV